MASSRNRIIKNIPPGAQTLKIDAYQFGEEKEVRLKPENTEAPEAAQKEAEAPSKDGTKPEKPEKRESAEEQRKRQLEKEYNRILEEARAQGEEILDQAKKEAKKREEEAAARMEAEERRVKEEAKKSGYQDGLEQGRKEGQMEGRQAWEQQVSSFEQEARQALESIKEAKEACLQQYLDELKDCVVAAAEKVIRISLKSSGEVIRQMILSATEKLEKSAWVKIYIDRTDYEMLVEADRDFLSSLSHLSDNIKFVVMDQEEEGSCIIERPEEVLDISVNSQMENIKDILAKM